MNEFNQAKMAVLIMQCLTGYKMLMQQTLNISANFQMFMYL